jgi:hypothetical protein
VRRAVPILVALLAVVPLVGGTAGTAHSAVPTLPRVTFIGDSIASSIAFTAPAKALLARSVDLDLEVAVCRRLVGQSCPYEGAYTPTLVDLVPTIRLAPTVVVAVGYNDFESTFPQTIETTLAALRKAGAQRVLWLTYREQRGQYVGMNDDLRAAAARHPELTIVDWNGYSRSHPDWFQDDGLHLGYGGAVGMATLTRNALVDVGVADPPLQLLNASRVLPPARVGRPYVVQLRVAGAKGAVRWRVQVGALPAGLRLADGGRISGRPLGAAARTVRVRATDARGLSASWPLQLVVRAA